MTEKRIQAQAVRDLCGDVSDMWLWRKLNDPHSGFPRPVYISKRRFWKQSEIVEWLEALETKAAA